MNILVVEDNLEVAEFIKDILEEESDFKVTIKTEFNDTEAEADMSAVDMVLLDENLNGRSGLEYLQAIRARAWYGPVIFVTANDREETIKKAFEVGADDYVIKPFKPLVLVGKIRALSQRCGLTGNNVLKVGFIEVYPNEHKVRVNKDEVGLTLTEYRILKTLVESSGNLVTRDTLKQKVFDGLHVTNRTIDVHICALRKKLGPAQNSLKTVRGVGYRLVESAA